MSVGIGDDPGGPVPEDAPGMVIPPPLIYLPAVALGFLTDAVWPVALLPSRLQYGLGCAFMTASLVLVLSVLREFSRAHTHFDARKPVTTLLTSGPFRITRNPAYVSLTLLCVGIAVATDTVWILVWLVPSLVMLDRLVIRREERFLERKFGTRYLQYKASVRRWL